MHVSAFARHRIFPAGAWTLIALLMTAPVFAAEPKHQAHEDKAHAHGAHEHGVSKLKLAVEDAGLEIELISPGADIVGFEHAPSTDADKLVVEKAAAMLRRGDSLFVMPAPAGCRMVSAEVKIPKADDYAGEKHHAHADTEKDTHSEFHARYRFRCATPERLTHIDTRFFESFPGAREIEAQAITPAGQIVRELTPTAARLKL
tara:strand:- start:5296 stop:5904 length:609 start_codon:yes stop_codon:yes gene_type:complete